MIEVKGNSVLIPEHPPIVVPKTKTCLLKIKANTISFDFIERREHMVEIITIKEK